MTIQWYPGHMTKARREMAEAMAKVDVIIEALDARLPRACENPLVYEMREGKPCLKVLTKSDIADPVATKAWLAYFERERSEPSPEHPQGRVVAIALSSNKGAETRSRVYEQCKRLALRPSGPGGTIRAMVVGVPNVGKSTLINTLMERKVANVGDEPAVTKAKQMVTLKNGMILTDHPGMLWPKIENQAASFRLALSGSIPDSAIDYEGVALFGAKTFMERYPQLLVARYKLKALPDTPDELLREIGRKRGALVKGGTIDMHKAGGVLIHDYRSGALGRITLELPSASAPRVET
ncbi:MAG: ribosome biogenesis GTPase YlqF [Polyangiaceae bacterium]